MFVYLFALSDFISNMAAKYEIISNLPELGRFVVHIIGIDIYFKSMI